MTSTTLDLAHRRHWAATDRDQPAATRADAIDETLHHLEDEHMLAPTFGLELMNLNVLEKQCNKQLSVVNAALESLSDFVDGELTIFAKNGKRPAQVAKRANDLIRHANAEVDRLCSLHSDRRASHRRCLEAYPEFARSRAAGVIFL